MVTCLGVGAFLPAAHHRHVRMRTSMSATASGSILRRVDKWACVSGCGACCKLGPLSSRPDLPSYLTPDELTQYTAMIGPDDWCVNFDKENRLCKIYETRPGFCVVDTAKMKDMFDVEEEEINDFAAFCCREHIGDNYGENSIELERFEAVIDSLWDEEDEEDEEDEVGGVGFEVGEELGRGSDGGKR